MGRHGLLAQSLRAFRDSFYRCLHRRADALFELTDAILTAGCVPSPVHLSLATVHRRGRVASTPRSVGDAWTKELCGACSLGTSSQTGTPVLPLSTPWTSRCGRPMDLAGLGRLRPAEAGACHRRRREAALGASQAASAVDPHARPAGFRDAPSGSGYPGEAPETLREASRSPEGQSFGAGQASPGAQNGRLSKPRMSGGHGSLG
jgi:hypothetical protein